MRPGTWLRRNWREATLVAIIVIPWLSLLLLGLLWLWQQGHAIIWLLAAFALGLTAWPLRRSIRRRAKARVAEDFAVHAKPSPAWGATANAAWEDVTTLAEATPPLGFGDANRAPALARQTVEVVAKRFFPDDPTPWAHFSVPEALLLAEHVARDLRGDILRNVPGVRFIRLDHALWLQRQQERHGALVSAGIRIGYPLYRIGRALLNPKQAAASELKTLVYGQTEGVLSHRLRSYGTRLIVLEVGRAAVELYSGNLRLSEAEIAEARAVDQAGAAAKVDDPVRIVLAGQVNSGKSSLVNAMAQEVLSEVSVIPTPAGVVDHVLRMEAKPALILTDTPGLTTSSNAHATISEQSQRADMVVWVISAVQPARSADVVALRALRDGFSSAIERRPPPILVALTQIDRLRPASDWAPPYDVQAPIRAKARTIRAAMDAVATALDVPIDSVIPVAAPPGAAPYNHDALWGAIGRNLDQARLRQIERLRTARDGFSVAELAAQVGRVGRNLVKGAVVG
jgi:predicted GTPase